MKKLSLIAGGVATLALGTVLATRSHAADHLDSLATLAGTPMGDINDVYTWMTADTKSLNLVMTVSPADPGTRTFSDAIQYVFHVISRAGDPSGVIAHPGGTETKVICTFASNTSVQCWAVQGLTVKGYVTGNPSATGGIESPDHKLKVFAGRRSDPFFFNLQGFRNATKFIHDNFAGVAGAMNTQGCPAGLPDATVGIVRGFLTTAQPTDAAAVPACADMVADCFAPLNVMAIVVQADKTLFNDGTNSILSVWASTHAKP